MNPSEILENIRQKFYDAKLLNENGRFANSIYLCGYCVELSLKHAITRNLNWSSYRTDNKFRFLKVHDLDFLVALTGDEVRIKKLPYWSIVMKWSENKRYEDPGKSDKSDSDSMITATKKNGGGFMRDLVIKIEKNLSEIEAEKGKFIIKCLVARNPDDIQWDLILAATWFDEDQIKRLEYLSEKILGDFDADCMSQFSAIITIDPDSDLAKYLMQIKEGYILRHNEIDSDVVIETRDKQAPMVVLLNDIKTPEIV